MKSTTIVSAILCASLGFSTLSFAQDYEHHDQRHEQRQDERQYGHEQYRDHDQRVEHSERRDLHYGHEAYYNARGPEFRRGGYIPREFRNHYYTVADYRSHRLSPPPRGHQWVQVGSDYVLIAVATGLIAGLVLSH